MADVLIALGGNVGDVRATFNKAISNICGMTQAALLARSSDYTTPPWGDEAQDPFVNAIIDFSRHGFDNTRNAQSRGLIEGRRPRHPRHA